jgi:4-alpha-glucanotransferase
LLGDEQAREQVSQERARDKRALFEALQVAGLLPEGYPAAAAEGAELSGELHSAITGFLASTPCLLMTLNQEDLTKEPLQQNLPGTTWQYPNWRRKMRYTVEELDELPIARAYARMLDDWLRRTGRRRVLH